MLDDLYGNLSTEDSYDHGSITFDSDEPNKFDKPDRSKKEIIKRRTLDYFGISWTKLDSGHVSKTSPNVSLSCSSTESYIQKSSPTSTPMSSPDIENLCGGSIKSKNEEKERVKKVNDESLDDWIDQIEKNCDFSKPVKDMEKEIETPQTLEDLMDEIEQEYDAMNAYNNKEKRLHGSSKTLSFSDENLFRLESEILNYYG